MRWFVLDAGSIDDVDYSAGISLGGLLDYLTSRNITFGLARLDESLSTTLGMYGLLDRIPAEHRFSTLEEALAAFRADTRDPNGPVRLSRRRWPRASRTVATGSV